MRPEEPRSFGHLREVRLEDEEEARYWAERLGASPEEIAKVVEKVGCSRTAVELFFTAPPPERTRPSSAT